MSSGMIAVDAWNTDEGSSSFDCKANTELFQYFVRQEPVPVLLLVDRDAEWDQELENVYLVSRSKVDGADSEHYEYELRPDCEL
jgi:hypothetical protein